MNLLSFDPIRAMSHDFLRVSHDFAIPPKLYKRSKAAVRLERRARVTGEDQHQNKDKSQARRGGTLTRKLLL